VSTPGATSVVIPGSSGKARGWLISVLATVVSTYALDAVATVGGVLLVASGVLNGLGHAALLVMLAGSYVMWGAGLRVNLRANFELLEAIGTSSNAFSKLGYELARRRSDSTRSHKVAAAVGYVGTEVAKELPYYAAAFGVALASDGLTSADAIIFLAGTNLGAGLYEYGLGRLTRVCLLRPSSPGPRLID
jgi:hypothetical protein